MFSRPTYVPPDHKKKQERDSIRKVPILKPEQIQKLDHLKKFVNNPQKNHGNKARESIRPSRGSIRPSKSLKKSPLNHQEAQRKVIDKDRDQSSGLTKELTLRSNQKSQNSKRRMTRAIQQREQQSVLDKCCGMFSKNQRHIESPFKAARQASYRK